MSKGTGKGAKLVIRLPPGLEEAPAPRRGEPALADPRRRRVLIVDDDPDLAEGLQALVEAFGHEVRTAASGPEALAVARAFSPEAVLCDIELPGGMNGHEVARAFRQETERPRVCLVALTGYGQAEDRQRSREAGFDVHLTKPVEPAELEQLLGELPGASASAAVASAVPSSGAGDPPCPPPLAPAPPPIVDDEAPPTVRYLRRKGR